MTAYDEFLYPGHPYAQTHPDRLATIATLFGMTPAPIERCRVLEIACGDGANLIPMAYGLPAAEFVGFDLAPRPIESAKEMAARLGLSNVSLSRLDLTEFRADTSRFDYIVAHGLYSWIPAAARDRLLSLIASVLAPAGVALVSYNTYPGCYLRRMVWEMLRFHTDHLEDPQSRIAEARAVAQLVAGGHRVPEGHDALLQAELERLMRRDPAFIFHDDLAEINEPLYFHEFVERAREHRLQFLGEAELAAMSYGGLTQETRRVLDHLDFLTREQYLDFIRNRRFRHSLLCHADVGLDREINPAILDRLVLTAGSTVRVKDDGTENAEAPCHDDKKSTAATRGDEALLQAILDALVEASPRRLTLDALRARVAARPDATGWIERGPEFFRKLVLAAARIGAIELHVHAPGLATEPGEKPAASLLARLQIETGSIVTSLCHDSVKVDNEIARRLLLLLDGTRSRAELAGELGDLLPADAHARGEALAAHLSMLAKLALLVA